MFYPMKRSSFPLFFLIFCATVTAFAQKKITEPPAEPLQLKELKYDFGKIPQGRPVIHNFEGVNKGKSPLMLNSVEASCGCTSPEWTQEPIAAGATSVIKVGFNAAAEGAFL